jgi:type I restriction enzyme S subunit
LAELGTGTTFEAISGSILRNFSIPVAPREEQTRVVQIIEELLSELGSAEESLNRARLALKRYRQAVLKAAVGGEVSRDWREAHQGEIEPAAELLKRILAERRRRWEESELAKMRANGIEPKDEKWKSAYRDMADRAEQRYALPEGWIWVRLGDIGSVAGGLTKNPKRSKLDRKLPYLRVANVYSGHLRLDNVEEIGVDDAELERTLLQKDDLLVVEGNGSPDQIGRVAVWDGSIHPCVHQNHIIKARFVQRDLSRWCSLFLLSTDGREAKRSRTSSIPRPSARPCTLLWSSCRRTWIAGSTNTIATGPTPANTASARRPCRRSWTRASWLGIRF